MKTTSIRTNNRLPIFLAAVLSLLFLCDLSFYFFSTADQPASYSETSPHHLQEIPSTPMVALFKTARSFISNRLQTAHHLINLSLDGSFNLSKVATHFGTINPIQTASAKSLKHDSGVKILFASSDQDSISLKLYSQLQTIFKNVAPIKQRLRRGDRANVIYDQAGHIQLATLTVGHKTFQAVRYTDSHGVTGYYSPSGQALFKSLFLSAPLIYKRISDGYTLHRWHPILHITRPHYGIDYAAPTGTPIRAIASGQISFSGWGGGYGKAVVIRHNSRYKSLYAHMSKINYTVKPGQWVNQGDVIGYVGSTGLATGPHLHFGLYEYGKPANPATALPKFNTPTHIAQRDLPDFLAKTNRLLTQLAFAQNRNPING